MKEANIQTIKQEVIKTIAKRLGVADSTITHDAYLFDDLNASRLEIADIIQTLEETYQLKFNIEEVKTFEKVEDIIDYIIDNAQ